MPGRFRWILPAEDRRALAGWVALFLSAACTLAVATASVLRGRNQTCPPGPGSTFRGWEFTLLPLNQTCPGLTPVVPTPVGWLLGFGVAAGAFAAILTFGAAIIAVCRKRMGLVNRSYIVTVALGACLSASALMLRPGGPSLGDLATLANTTALIALSLLLASILVGMVLLFGVLVAMGKSVTRDAADHT